MAGIAPQYQPQPLPQSEFQPPSSAEEEALKRNTDCVYFLASPLTCKKGRECEFRHSDVARLNPTDCWYWLNGNCLNPKCGFRHPPLDGMLGMETPMSTGPSLPTPMNFSTPTAYTPNVSGKQAVQCIFFQSGFCAKGDWCPFLHGPIFTSNKAPLKPGAPAPSAAKPVTHEKAFSGPEKCVQEKKVPPVVINKPNKISPQAITPAVKVAPVPSRNEFSINKTIPYTTDVNKFSAHMNIPSGNPRVQKPHQVYEPKPHRVYEPEIVNNKDAEVVSREPSPGFDVLVDDEGRDSEYYPGEDQYVMTREHEKGNDYEIGRSTDFDKINYVDHDRFRDPLGYDSHEPFKGQHAWDHKPSSERMSRASYVERRPYPREDIHARVDELDLRHQLVKHKKANGLRSVISQEHTRDRYISQEHTRNGYNSQELTGDRFSKDRSYRGFRRDEQHISMRESSIGSRLQGRIRLPERSFSTDRDIIRNGDRRRMSPARAIMPLHPGRVRDRRNGSVEEPSYNGRKNYGGMSLRSEIMDDKFANFAGPKSLAELKNRKSSERDGPDDVTDQPSLGKRKHFHQDSDNGVSFEGPKPLKEILKRKKGETIESLGNLSDKEDIIVNNRNEGLENDSSTVGFNNQLDKSAEEESNPLASKLEVEDGLIIEEESEAYEQRDEEFEYEQEGGEDLELYEHEDVEEVEYYDEDEDDDDFAKKMGVKYA